MRAQPSVQIHILMVRVPSKYEVKRLTFEYSTDYFVFSRITGWGGALNVPYLRHFAVVSNDLRCVGKVSYRPFEPCRCALVNPRWSGGKVSTTIHVELLMPLTQVLFASARSSAWTDMPKVRTPTNFHEKRITFEVDMNYFVF